VTAETFLRFRAAGFDLALPVTAVEGIHEPVPTSPLPGLEPAITGLAVIHGRASTVIDLDALLALSASGRRRLDPEAEPILVALAEPAGGLALLVRCEPSLRPGGEPSPPPPGPAAALCQSGFRDRDGTSCGVIEPANLIRRLERDTSLTFQT
jgi:hypothetical protein